MPYTQLFRRSSTTYFFSSLFFPKEIRDDVFILYAYVRTADNFVDSTPQEVNGFHRFKKETEEAFAGKKINNPIIASFYSLSRKHALPYEWTNAFLQSMEMDVTKKEYETKEYKTYEELNRYMYGSAAVIGLMMAQIMNLPQESHHYAKVQGTAMQLINFIRDIREDLELGRVYIPQEDMDTFGLSSLEYSYTKNKKEMFRKLITFEIERYRKLQQEAEKGYSYLPKRLRVAVKTAADRYRWTADVIAKDPFIVYRQKVKPSPISVIFNGILNTLTI